MKELEMSVDATIKEHSTPDQPRIELDHAAERWAVNSLRVYDGTLWTKALAISKAMAEFTAELQRKER